MNVLFIINTSAQAYTWKNVIISLQKKNHEVHIIARDYGPTTRLLNSFGLKFSSFKPRGSGLWRLLGALDHFQQCYGLSRKFTPSIVIGFGVDASITALRSGKPSIVFNDSEPIGIQNILLSLTASKIITPACFRKNLGRRQVRMEGFKELAYIHPDYFTPDLTIYSELGLSVGEKFVILRFNVFDAAHDIGKRGFTRADQIQLVHDLEPLAHVFISPEGPLTPELEKYRLPIADHRIHHALYFAQLLVTDTQTMTTEAAILGTPAVRCNNFVGPRDMGNFIELEQRYDMIFSFQKPALAIQKSIELLSQPDLKGQWARKRERLLSEKVDFNQFMLDFIQKFNLRTRQ